MCFYIFTSVVCLVVTRVICQYDLTLTHIYEDGDSNDDIGTKEHNDRLLINANIQVELKQKESRDSTGESFIKSDQSGVDNNRVNYMDSSEDYSSDYSNIWSLNEESPIQSRKISIKSLNRHGIQTNPTLQRYEEERDNYAYFRRDIEQKIDMDMETMKLLLPKIKNRDKSNIEKFMDRYYYRDDDQDDTVGDLDIELFKDVERNTISTPSPYRKISDQSLERAYSKSDEVSDDNQAESEDEEDYSDGLDIQPFNNITVLDQRLIKKNLRADYGAEKNISRFGLVPQQNCTFKKTVAKGPFYNFIVDLITVLVERVKQEKILDYLMIVRKNLKGFGSGFFGRKLLKIFRRTLYKMSKYKHRFVISRKLRDFLGYITCYHPRANDFLEAINPIYDIRYDIKMGDYIYEVKRYGNGFGRRICAQTKFVIRNVIFWPFYKIEFDLQGTIQDKFRAAVSEYNDHTPDF